MAGRPGVVVACLALSLLAVAGGAARAQGDRLATIAGHVFAADTNLPVADATVRLTGQGRPRATPADASGRYEFADVPPGRYVVSATMSGYAVGTYGQSRPTDPPASFALRPAESRAQIDVWLTPLAVVSGQIVDERGAPAAGAQVRAVRMTRSADPLPSAMRGPVEAVTDANGDFRISNLDSGRYQVSATPARDVGAAGALTRAPTYYPGTEFPDQAQPLRVEAGMQAHVIIALRPSRLARISGRVLDAAGRPAVKQVVLLNGQPPTAPSLPMTAAIQELDASGRFTFPAVPPGDYRLDVRDTAGFEEIARRGAGPAPVLRRGEFASQPLRITGDDVVDLVLRTGTGFTLSGQVVVKAAGAPSLRGVRVSALPADGLGAMSGGLLTGTAEIGEDGSFRIENMAGQKAIRVTGLPAGLTLEGVRVHGVDVVDEGIEITAPVPLEIVLGRPTQITGRVVDQEGTGIPGPTVVVFSEEPFRRALPHSRYVATTVAGGSGAFTVTGLPPGRYRAVALFAPVEGQAADVESLELLAGFGTAISLGERERVSLTVPIR